jgi:fatty acid kinase
VLERLDAAAVHRWCAVGLDALRRHQQEIDDLNVYPVPDGDTGTNLVLTLAAAHDELAGEVTGLAEDLRRMARGALLGARGNSGVIVAQMVKGIAEAFAAAPVPDGQALATAFAEAARLARAAVAAPVEGTVLSVADGAARAAAEAGTTLGEVAARAAKGASEALARTPEQLAALARAGVVDAGGRGLCVLLDALVEVVTGIAATPSRTAVPRRVRPRETGSPEYAYEVQYLLDAPEPAIGPLRAALAGLGDSLVVVGAEGSTWNVHVHVNDIGAAIEAGIEAGRPRRITVTRFADQPSRAPAGLARAIVAVVTGAGLTEVFACEGAVTVAGPSPSTAEILGAIRHSGATEAVVLPNAGPVQAVAAAAADEARAEGVRVGVVPTRSPVQALAALAVRDPARRFEDDLVAMADAAGACRYAEVTVAVREAVTVAGVCQPGDVIALVDGEVNLIGAELGPTCRALVDRMLAGGGELITLVTGDEAPDDLGPELREYVTERWPFVEVQVLAGGPPRYPLVVGVE